ncbi:2-oxoadipate dioxygenase/decarboxylase [Mariniluteicoccus flavus]
MALVPTWQLRARFAVRLAELYGGEVPAYNTLVDVSTQVNRRVMDREGAAAERLGTIDRVTAERHGAIRVGSPAEMSQVARVFGAFGMYPTGFYDLRDAQPQPIPVVSTAYRPHDADELAKNPFRVFTSMLVPQDRRFFTEDQERRLIAFLDARELFGPELLELADRAEAQGGLEDADADRFLQLAGEAFELSTEPVDRAWYEELSAVSGVAADIGGITSTHINHLTPRVLDIDDLYESMQALGIEMISEIQGPPGWEGPDLLLRQTSFRALAEDRAFREADGSVTTGQLRVRFGEVEQRGIALTPKGRELFDAMTAESDRRLAETEGGVRVDVARDVWREMCPRTEEELHQQGLAYFHYEVDEQRLAGGRPDGADLQTLIAEGWLTAEPIVYEDFLPRSAAGIFNSNLTSRGAKDESQQATERDMDWLSSVIGRAIKAPEELYAAQSDASLDAAAARLGLAAITR